MEAGAIRFTLAQTTTASKRTAPAMRRLSLVTGYELKPCQPEYGLAYSAGQVTSSRQALSSSSLQRHLLPTLVQQ